MEVPFQDQRSGTVVKSWSYCLIYGRVSDRRILSYYVPLYQSLFFLVYVGYETKVSRVGDPSPLSIHVFKDFVLEVPFFV